MSLSDPKLTNPATKFISFKAEENKFVYWNKDEEKNIEIPLPVYFIVLDELTTIRGYHPASNSGIYSNEVKFLNDEILNVKSFKGNLNIVGKYNDIKDSIKANGGKYAKSVYAALMIDKNTIEMVNFNFGGSACSAWIEKKFNTEKFGVVIKETMIEEGKKGSYYIPIFGKLNFPEGELLQKAIEMDRQLQNYLKAYRNIKNEEIESTNYNDQMKEFAENDRITTEEATKTLYPEMVSEKADKLISEDNLNPTDDLPF